MQRSGKKYHMKMGNQGIIGGKLRLPTQSFPRYLVLPAPLLYPNPPAAPTLLSDTPFMQRLQSHQRKKSRRERTPLKTLWSFLTHLSALILYLRGGSNVGYCLPRAWEPSDEKCKGEESWGDTERETKSGNETIEKSENTDEKRFCEAKFDYNNKRMRQD